MINANQDVGFRRLVFEASTFLFTRYVLLLLCVQLFVFFSSFIVNGK